MPKFVFKFSFLLTALLFGSFETKAQSKVIVEQDSIYKAQYSSSKGQELPKLESLRSQSVMENDAIYRQLRVFFFQKGLKISDKGLDCFLSLQFYMTAQNELTAITYDFSDMFMKNNRATRVHYNPIQQDSLLNILGIREGLREFAPKLIFKQKYLSPHVHRLNFSLKGENAKIQENKLAILLENSRPDTVKVINLSKSDLREVPWKQLRQFKNAETLLLNENKLAAFPKQVLKLKKLKNIDISGNFLVEDSTFFKRHKRLEVLNIQNNGFTTLPTSLKKLKRITNLVMGNNSFKDIDQYKFQKHKRLTDLNFYNLNLDHVPPNVFKMKSLENLDLYFNNINYLDEDVAKLKTLKILALSYNDMWSLPSTINQIAGLKTIYAHHNQLSRLPDLPQSLELLDIGYNSFQEFPSNIHSLPFLKEIDYNKNELRDGIDLKLLPPNLKILRVSSNELFRKEEFEKQAEEFKKALEGRGVELN